MDPNASSDRPAPHHPQLPPCWATIRKPLGALAPHAVVR
jgi:hypothetical protein